jgi:trimethylamine--corrinoid protein Co-methyltransferase
MMQRERRKKSKENLVNQLPWQEVMTEFSALEIISEDEIESIHHASLDVLERVGMKILHQDARKIFKDAGLDVDESSQMVHFDRDLVLSNISKAPREFTLEQEILNEI